MQFERLRPHENVEDSFVQVGVPGKIVISQCTTGNLGYVILPTATMPRFWRLLLLLFVLAPQPCTGLWQLLYSLVFGSPPPTVANSCHCVSPFDEELCRKGAVSMCRSLVCFDNDSLCENQPVEKLLFLEGCNALANILQRFNCAEDKSQFFPTESEVSDRENAAMCYSGGRGIRHTTPPRGNCDPGGCCQAQNLCPNERIMHFISLGYGITVDSGEEACESSVDFYGEGADCSFVTDGRSNDALVCRDAKVLIEESAGVVNYCDVSFTATNDIFDMLGFVRNYINVGDQRRVKFHGEATMEFTAIRSLVDIALGPADSPGTGIIDIAFESLLEKGCFTRENPGVHIVGHSLGGYLTNVLALKIASLYPDVDLRIHTAGEPAGLVEPLTGNAAALPVWRTKVRYITGMVLPVSNAVDGIGLRSYDMYQTYDFVPQVIPGGIFMEGGGATTIFLCESLLENGRLSYFMTDDRRGCAANRRDVRNSVATFPMEGILREPSFIGATINFVISLFFRNIDDDLRRSISVWLSVASSDLREDFIQVLDSHLTRRYMKMLGKITRNGDQCDADSFIEPTALVETCLS